MYSRLHSGYSKNVCILYLRTSRYTDKCYDIVSIDDCDKAERTAEMHAIMLAVSQAEVCYLSKQCMGSVAANVTHCAEQPESLTSSHVKSTCNHQGNIQGMEGMLSTTL